MPTYQDHKQVGAWEVTKIMNDTTYPSRACDFVVERPPIKTEIAQVVAVCDEFVKPIDGGELADNAAEVRQKLNDAGAQIIINKVQRQLDSWPTDRHPDTLTVRSAPMAARTALGQSAPSARRLESAYGLQ